MSLKISARPGTPGPSLSDHRMTYLGEQARGFQQRFYNFLGCSRHRYTPVTAVQGGVRMLKLPRLPASGSRSQRSRARSRFVATIRARKPRTRTLAKRNSHCLVLQLGTNDLIGWLAITFQYSHVTWGGAGLVFRPRVFRAQPVNRGPEDRTPATRCSVSTRTYPSDRLRMNGFR